MTIVGKASYDKVVFAGFKHSGKSLIGKMVAEKLGFRFVDIDDVIEDEYVAGGGEKATVREIYKKLGGEGFVELEALAIRVVAGEKGVVISLGGASPLNSGFDKALFGRAVFVYLAVRPDVLYERIIAKGIPPFLDEERPRGSMDELLEKRTPYYESISDIKVDNTDREPAEVAGGIIEELGRRYAG